MCLHPRYDEDPPWGDEDGFMWSDWLFNRYSVLNSADNRTESQKAEIDMIYDAAFKGRKALEKVELKLKE